jgi:hypothetical protein
MARPAVLDEQGDRFNIKLTLALGRRLRIFAAASRITHSQAVESILQEYLGDLTSLVRLNDTAMMPARGIGPENDPRIVPQDWDGVDFRKRLIQLGVTQKAFGKLLGIPQQTVNSWARHGISSARIQGVAQCLLTLPLPTE